ncbi:hypothetical protein Tco_0562160 [Tanacetum coccineum]
MYELAGKFSLIIYLLGKKLYNQYLCIKIGFANALSGKVLYTPLEEKLQNEGCLKNAGLHQNEDNVVSMFCFLKLDTKESISYGHVRNFVVLLPSNQLQEDSRNLWFQAATVVAVAPSLEVHTGCVLKSVLAGGLAYVFHGLQSGIFEASKTVLINFAPTLPDLQVKTAAKLPLNLIGSPKKEWKKLQRGEEAHALVNKLQVHYLEFTQWQDGSRISEDTKETRQTNWRSHSRAFHPTCSKGKLLQRKQIKWVERVNGC